MNVYSSVSQFIKIHHKKLKYRIKIKNSEYTKTCNVG